MKREGRRGRESEGNVKKVKMGERMIGGREGGEWYTLDLAVLGIDLRAEGEVRRGKLIDEQRSKHTAQNLNQDQKTNSKCRTW